MNKETYEALKRIIQALESGNTDFLGKELKLTNSWLDEVSKDYNEEKLKTCSNCGEKDDMIASFSKQNGDEFCLCVDCLRESE